MKNILFAKKEEVRNENFLSLTLNFPFQGSELIPPYTTFISSPSYRWKLCKYINRKLYQLPRYKQSSTPENRKRRRDIGIFVRCTETKNEKS